MRLWTTYFKEVGVPLDLHVFEYDEACARKWLETTTWASNSVHMHYGDQSETEDLQRALKRAGGKFDAIIDDGGHTFRQQTTSLSHLFVHGLAPGGFYFLEDTITSLIRGSYADSDESTMQFLSDTVTDMARSFDGVLIVTGHTALNKQLSDLVFRVDAVPGMYVLSKISEEQKRLVRQKVRALSRMHVCRG